MSEPAQDLPENPPENTGSRFEPGKSGNPGGRPKGVAGAVRRVLDRAAADARQQLLSEGKEADLASADGAELLARFWAGIMADPKEKTTDRLAASKHLVERGWGKPPEFAPLEDADPLDHGEVEDAARDFDVAVLRLAPPLAEGADTRGDGAEA